MTTTLPTPVSARLSTRQQVAVFGISLAALVLPAVAYAVSQGVDLAHIDRAPVGAQVALFGQAFAPALAALVTWAASGRPPAWGFRRTPWRTLPAAWLIGLLGTLLAYAVAWATGIAGFSADRLGAMLGVPAPVAALVGLLPGLAPYILLALGEQLGWSSLLVARLAETRSPDRTALIYGPVWAAFHVPMMLFLPGGIAVGVPAAWAILMFAIQCMALAFPLVWLRVRTGSIWPVLVLHAALNASLYFVAQPATVLGPDSGWFLGEGGLLTAGGVVAAVLATIPLWRKR
ncbi:CPBP family intramembrane glutamic endopeptidase [Naasia aerilata]|uniref:CAAX prenyl protease 2/Lysostaphin resistance protein A-like domain-containing protein n=1 Tax=Naasia aerilata TaxID=1162966 RepID=A0ABM8G898_9MICO|nr:CPBP family intramembrane glutamic endopeptidase [Naasia aerilata]BDZ44410.1 hypothetical protein GCM10025866_03190 [Naasia aerilata]